MKAGGIRWLASRRADWTEALDFIGPRPRAAPWAWLVLLAGLVALATVLPMVGEADAALVESQDAVRRLQRAARQHALKEAALRQGPGAAMPLTAEQLRQVNRVAQTLAYPWLPVLNRVEEAAAARQAVLLSLSLDLAAMEGRAGAEPRIKIGASVTSGTEALQWARAHGPGASLLRSERLSRPFETVRGHYEWRAETQWQGGRP